jgi:titin
VDVSWTGGASDAEGYLVERAAGSGPFAQVARTGVGVSSFSDSGVQPSTSYTYRVRAFNHAGESSSATSNVVITPADPTTAPAAPSNLSGLGVSSMQVDLTWKDNSNNETGFVIEDTTAGNGLPPAFAGSVAAGVTSFSVMSLKPGDSYVFRVKAVNAAGSSPYTSTIQVTVPNAPSGGQTVSAPSSLVGSPVSSYAVRLTWLDNAVNETGYAVERSNDGSSFQEVASYVQANLQSADDGGLQPATTYYYRVRAFTNNGTWADPKSGYSNTAKVVTPPLGAGSPPVNPGTLKAVAATQTEVDISWQDNSSDETGFSLERAVNGGPFVQIVSLAANTTSYPNTGLATGVSYTYRVRAVNGAGPSAYSNTASVTLSPPASTPPAAPSSLNASAAAGRVDLSWSYGAAKPDGFYVERSTGGAFSRIATVANPNALSFPDSTVAASQSYTYQVQAYNSAGVSGYSNTAFATVPSGSGGGGGGGGTGGSGTPPQPFRAAGSYLLSPGLRDGSNDTVPFDPEAREVLILDAQGRRVRRPPVPGPSWDGKDDRGAMLPSGVYVAKVTGKDGSVSYQKILIVK